MDENIEFIRDLFARLINQPIRHVELGHGSFITMGFGEDLQIEIIVRRKKEIHLRPEWYLWIYMCFWELEMADELLAASDDDREVIAEALKRLENKKFLGVEVLSKTYDMRLEFEGGIHLSLISNNSEDDYEQWRLFTPDKKVLVAGPFDKMTYDYSSKKAENCHK